MTTYYTFDGDEENDIAPHRPGTEDVGYDDLVDDAGEPPNPRTDPNAAAWNQRSKQLVGLAKVAASLKLTVTFSGGTPAVAKFSYPGTVLELADFTVVDNGTGDTTITWPENMLAPSIVDPHGVTLNTAQGMGFAAAVTNGVRVTTVNPSNAATDIGFTVEIG